MAKEKGMEELLAKRGKLKVQLEKLGRRIEEFPHCSELDMIQQVECSFLVKLSCHDEERSQATRVVKFR